MKKILLSAVAVMAFGVAAQAQDMKFGVKAGLNIANEGGDADTDGSLMGFHVGGVAEFKISETFSVQPEVLFSMMGAKQKIDTGFGTLEYDEKLSYISVPVMAKYYITEGLSIEAGPQVGFLISAKDDDEDVKDGFNGFDFGLGGGLAYDLPMGLFFQARYYAGMSNILKDSDDYKVQNNAIQLSVGYKF